MTDSELYTKTIALIDQANQKDPNVEQDNGKDWPKEFLYSQRMSDMINRYAPDADEIQKISVRAQHIERWKSPRSDYPMDRKGYHLWRTNLYQFHAEIAAKIMQLSGYDEHSISRVKLAIGKKKIKTNTDTQMLEDIAALVFLEHYLLGFADRNPQYDEAKWIDILQKTWRKMTERAQHFALNNGISLPKTLLPLIVKAVT